MKAPKHQETGTMETKKIIIEDRVEKLTLEELNIIKPNRGRKTTPSRYLEQVAEAAKTPGEAYKVVLHDTYDLTPNQVVSELRKAGKQLKLKIMTFNRSKEPKPFIGFTILEERDEADVAA